MYLKGKYGKYRCAFECISLRKILFIDIEYEDMDDDPCVDLNLDFVETVNKEFCVASFIS